MGSAASLGCGRPDGEVCHSEPLRFGPFQPLEVCCQLGEHVDLADHLKLAAELGANGFAVVVAGGDVPGHPLPPPVREGSV
jgi:hypothetical protein